MRKKHLSDAYRFPGFVPGRVVTGVFGDQYARVIQLKRRQKKVSVRSVAKQAALFTTTRHAECETYPAGSIGSTSSSRCAVFTAVSVAS